MVRFDADLFIKWTVESSYELRSYRNITPEKLKQIDDYMEDIIYNDKCVDAQLEYTTKKIERR